MADRATGSGAGRRWVKVLGCMKGLGVLVVLAVALLIPLGALVALAEVLGTFAVVAEPSGVASGLKARYGDVVDRINFYAPVVDDPETWGPVMEDLSRGLGSGMVRAWAHGSTRTR